ncbi:MAG: hypothetical protein RLY93_13150 [Sumerlaeia bacterium]
MNRAKRVWRKWPVWVGLCASPVVALGAVLWIGRLPETDYDDRVQEWVTAEIRQEAGQPLAEEFKRIEEAAWQSGAPNHKPGPLNIHMIQSYTDAPAVWSAPVARDELIAFMEKHGHHLDEWAALAETGSYYTTEPGQYFYVPDFLMLQSWCKLHRAAANAYAGAGDWDRAIAHARGAATIADPAKHSTFIGQLIAIAARGIGYATFEDLLRLAPDAETCRRIAAQVESLRASDPRITNKTAILEALAYRGRYENRTSVPGHPEKQRSWLAMMLERRAMANYMTSYGIQNLDPEAAEQDGPLSGLNQSWLHQAARRHPGSQARWTHARVVYERLNDLSREHPELVEYLTSVPDDVAQDAPFAERFFLENYYGGANYREAVTRARVAATRGALVQAAALARAQAIEAGAAPRDFSALAMDPDVGPAVPISDSTSLPAQTIETVSSGAIGDFHLGPVRLTGDNVGTFLAPVLAQNQVTQGTWNLAIPGDWAEATAITSIATGINAPALPMQAMAWQQTAVHFPPTRDASVRYATETKLSWSNREYEHVLTPEIARETFDEYRSEVKRLHRENVQTPSYRVNIGRPDIDTTGDYPAFLRLRADFVLPPAPQAVWSDGPDGENDGAAIAYDPTNGTISRGDIVTWLPLAKRGSAAPQDAE